MKGYYGDLTEKQFRRIFGDAERVKGDTGENLIGLLERRLDAVVYRAKFVATVFAARQFVNHGHILVNGNRVNIPSYRVKEGDVIEVRDKSKQIAVVLEATQLPERDVPEYLEVDHSKMTARFVRTPGVRTNLAVILEWSTSTYSGTSLSGSWLASKTTAICFDLSLTSITSPSFTL